MAGKNGTQDKTMRRNPILFLLFIAATAAAVDVANAYAQLAKEGVAKIVSSTEETSGVVVDATEGNGETALFEFGISVYQSKQLKLEQEKLSFEREKWETQISYEWWRNFFTVVGILFAILTVFFLGIRSFASYRQVKEQMLTSFRERLFSDSSSAVTAAAMSLSKYPHEAVWLVMRWAEINKEYKRLKEHFPDEERPHIKKLKDLKQAIQDAINDLEDRWSVDKRWYEIEKIAIPLPWAGKEFKRLLGFKWFVFEERIWKIPIYIPIPWIVKGARLDRRSITIPIGDIQLNGAYMVKGKYSGIGLESAKLREAHLEGANLSWAHLEGADLSGAHLKEADLNHAHLERTDLWLAHLEGADLREAHLEGVDLRCVYLKGADLSEAHLKGANLREAHLKDAVLDHANLEGANLSGAHLEEADLNNANLEGANLNEAHLKEGFLYGANLEGADLSLARLKGADLNYAHLEGANLREAHLEWADLSEADLKDVKNWKTIKSIRNANIFGVKNVPEGTDEEPGFVNWAKKNGAVKIKPYTEDHAKWNKKRKQYLKSLKIKTEDD